MAEYKKEITLRDLNESDRRVNAASGGEIGRAKQAWVDAKAIYDSKDSTPEQKTAAQEAMTAANNRANAAREQYGSYNGGTSGTDYIPVDNSGNSFSGGYSAVAYNPDGSGGKSYEQLKSEWNDYSEKWYRTGSQSSGKAWQNGYSTAMNVRSKANVIRQQMQANENAMATADDAYRAVLQNENENLAKWLGGSTTYNEDKGRWETWNPNVGYGYNMNGTQANIRNAWKNYYGYTDDQIENWAKDTSRYYNFVDVMAPARNTIDESSGFTGQYAQFVNGPYIPGTHYTAMEDVYGDGFGDEGAFVSRPQYDKKGNIIQFAPALKGNNSASAYTQQFLPVPVNGVLTGHGPGVSAMDPNTGSNNAAGQRAYYQNYGRYAGGKGASGGGSVGSYEDYLRQLYASALEAQLKSLESGYQTNLSELDASQTAIDSAYKEQKRQTSGENARQSAAWREVANAYGLNSGAVGQANLAQRNQLQSNLNALNAAQASARTELQRQRLLLGQQYQSAIEQAVEENNSQLALNLYQEAVRAEEAIRQQEQFYANLALQYGKSMSSFAKNTDSMSMEAQFSLIEEAVKNGYISEAQALYWAQQLGLV